MKIIIFNAMPFFQIIMYTCFKIKYIKEEWKQKATYLVLPFNRNQLKDQLLMASSGSSTSAAFLLESVVMLIEPQVSWSCKIVAFLLQRNVFYLIREIIFTAKVNFLWPSGWWFLLFVVHALVIWKASSFPICTYDP